MSVYQTRPPGELLEASRELLRTKPLSPYKPDPEIVRGERSKVVFIFVEEEEDG